MESTVSISEHSDVSSPTGEQPSQKSLLKDIFIECSLPHQFNDELSLAIMRSDDLETLRLNKISPTKWKALENIDFDHETGPIKLVIISKDGGAEAFLEFSADEISAMACAEEVTAMEHVFVTAKEDNPISFKITSAVVSSSIFSDDDMNRRLLAQFLRSEVIHADAFFRCFKETGNVDDINQAISHFATVISLIQPGLEAIRPEMSYGLGTSYLLRFQQTGDPLDIDRSISHLQIAVRSTPSGHARLPTRSSELGNAYLRRFELTSDLQDIEFAISHHRTAVELAPPNHADLPSFHNNLGGSYLIRFDHSGNLQDIDLAISHHQSAADSTPPSHANFGTCFNNLGNSYFSRFKHLGHLQDIECAISHHLAAVKFVPSGHADRLSHLNNLANSYLSRFERSSDLQDIDLAISHHLSAVQATPSTHASLPPALSNLGIVYAVRFDHTGDLQDIDRAISHLQAAVESTPSGHAALPNRFNSLGNSYSSRYKRTGDLHDIDCSISHHKSALKSTPSCHADYPNYNSNLGNSYALRFEHAHDLQDIDHSIFHHQIAVQSTPSHRADLPGFLINLGISHSSRFQKTSNLLDIDHSISLLHDAVKSTPPGHADLPGRLANLGNSYTHRFEHSRDPADVQNSIASYRQAAEANGNPSIRLVAARHAARISSVHDKSHCLPDFALSISLLSEAAGLEQTIHRRHANLLGYSNLVGSAVATALDFNQADLALEWLEQGRCLVWNQLNQLRTPIDDLRLRSPSLADRFLKVAGTLESDGTRLVSSIPSSNTTLAEDIRLQDDTRNHTSHAAEYKQLLKEIRDLPDFHDFLQPSKAANLLSSLPSTGPVIVINIHKSRCDALALIAGMEEPLQIPLGNFSLVQAEQLQKMLLFDLLKQREMEDKDRIPQRVQLNASSMSFVLKELWCNVVGPILKALGYSVTPPNFLDRRRLWWCPTGSLSFLPLHAAGIYGSAYQPGSCISDFVVSSYTPTLRSLNDKFITASTSSRCTNLFLISQPNTPGFPSIPATRDETHAVEGLMKGTTVDTLLLEDSNATRESVKAELKSHSWVHFACHGVQDIYEPLESGLCLHDGRLGLLEIMRQQIPNPDLAFLSACQTSKGDAKLSEEVVHLAAGMLAVGYRGVVGTMWSISDTHGPRFAEEFYQYLLRENVLGGLDSTRAAYALDYATRKVRESLGEGDAALLTWVPYVHFGY